MDKMTLLEAVRDLAAAGELTEAEVVTAVRGAADTREAEVAARSGRYSTLLYFIGGGVISFVAWNWEHIPDAVNRMSTSPATGSPISTSSIFHSSFSPHSTAALVFIGSPGVG